MPVKNLASIIILWSFIVSTASAENVYFTATGEENENPLIFRSLQSVPKGAKESEYPFLISVYWPYGSNNDSGMPDASTNEAQIIFEDALESLDSLGVSHLMLVVTGNGRKEWHWYVRDIEDWMQRMNTSLAGKSVFPIEIENSHQPDWSLYHRFVSGVEGI